MPLSFEQIVAKLKTKIQHKSFFNVIDSVADGSLNSPQDRFLKAEIIEEAFAEKSQGFLKYVNKTGRDFQIVNDNTYLEGKYQDSALFTPKKRELKKQISLKLMNSNGTNTHKKLPKDYAPILIIFDRIGCAAVKVEDIKQYIKIQGDGIKLDKCPSELLTILFKTKAGKYIIPKVSAKAAKQAFIKQYISQF